MLDSYVEIDLDKIGGNARAITQKYSGYKYFIAVLKGDAYGHGMEVANEMYKNGINYFAVSSVEEAESFRKINSDAPLLCLHPIHPSRLDKAKELNLTIAVNELSYLKKLLNTGIDYKFKIHLQIDTGFNRLGFKDKNEVKTAVDMINESNFELEGIYQHFATAGIFDKHWDEQVENFKELTSLIDLKAIPIVHMGSSVSMLTHPKQPFTTGVRMGIAIYGYNVSPDSLSNSPKDMLRKLRNDYYTKKYNISETYCDVKIDLKPAMKMKTRILQLKRVSKGEWFGYNASFTADDDMILAILPIGYNNGIGHSNFNRKVEINGKLYPIIGEPCMNMTAIRVDESVKPDDEVTLLGDRITVGMFARGSGMGNAEALVNIGKNNPRFYIKDGQVLEGK